MEYRNYIKFNTEFFLHELGQKFNKDVIFKGSDKQYDLFSDIFKTILDHHVPLKSKK